MTGTRNAVHHPARPDGGGTRSSHAPAATTTAGTATN